MTEKGRAPNNPNRLPDPTPPLIVPGCWLLSRLSKGGQSGIFLSLIDCEEIPLATAKERYVGAVLKSYNFENQDVVREGYRRERLILESLQGDRNLLIKAWQDEVKGRLLMRWVDGPTLDQFLDYVKKTKKPIPLPFALLIASDLLHDLALVHTSTDVQGNSLKIVHRDICRQNVMITTHVGTDRCALLLDFGIATLNEEDRRPFGLGRSIYLAPEELEAARVHKGYDSKVILPAAQSADVYSTALVIAELFLGESVRGNVLDKRITDEWMLQLPQEGLDVCQRVKQAYSLLPQPFFEVIQRALSFDPKSRFQNGESFCKAWDSAIEASALTELGDPESRQKLTHRLKKYASYLHRLEEKKLADKLAEAKRMVTGMV